jgi:hypothetical protein
MSELCTLCLRTQTHRTVRSRCESRRLVSSRRVPVLSFRFERQSSPTPTGPVHSSCASFPPWPPACSSLLSCVSPSDRGAHIARPRPVPCPAATARRKRRTSRGQSAPKRGAGPQEARLVPPVSAGFRATQAWLWMWNSNSPLPGHTVASSVTVRGSRRGSSSLCPSTASARGRPLLSSATKAVPAALSDALLKQPANSRSQTPCPFTAGLIDWHRRTNKDARPACLPVRVRLRVAGRGAAPCPRHPCVVLQCPSPFF